MTLFLKHGMEEEGLDALERELPHWRDWMIVFALLWIFSALKPKSSASPVLLATGMAYLLGIYILGQLPHALAALGVVTGQ